MELNIYIFFVAALIPLAIGAVWYNPKVLGNAWMASTGLKEEDLEGGNMLKIFGLAYVLSVLVAFGLYGMVVHQQGFMSLMVSEPGFGEAGSEVQKGIDAFLANYGDKHRSFGHGLFHGILNVILFIIPVIGTVALFERRSFKYVAIHAGYWIISVGLMGGVIAQFV